MGFVQNCSKLRVFDGVKHSSSVLVHEMQQKLVFVVDQFESITKPVGAKLYYENLCGKLIKSLS